MRSIFLLCLLFLGEQAYASERLLRKRHSPEKAMAMNSLSDTDSDDHGEAKENALDPEFRIKTPPRPHWKKGRWQEVIKDFSSPQKGVYCGICATRHQDGIQELTFHQGKVDEYKVRQRLDLDHVQTWAKIRDRIKKSLKYLNASSSEQKSMLLEAFNHASELRPACRKCNIKRTGNTPTKKSKQQIEAAQQRVNTRKKDEYLVKRLCIDEYSDEDISQ